MRPMNIFRTMAVAGAVLLAPSMLSAQIAKPLSFAVYGGASVPMGDASDAFNTGYTVGGSMDLRAPMMPFGLRGELGYSSMSMKGLSGTGASAKTTDLGGNLNLVTWMPSVIVKPYLTAGGSYSRIGASATDGETTLSGSENHFGFNAGGGIDFPLGPIPARIDIRYKQISMGKDDQGNSATLKTVPLTFGIRF